MKRILHILLLAAISLVTLTSCEKDEEGYYLSPTYCTATADGVEYIDRMKSKLPGVFLGITSPQSYRDFEGPSELGESDILPVLHIQTTLSSPSNVFRLYFFLRNVEPGENLVGREFKFTPTEPFGYLTSDEVYPVMARDKIDIAVSDYNGIRIPCSGTLRIKEYDSNNKCIFGDFSILDGSTRINGSFYCISLK